MSEQEIIKKLCSKFNVPEVFVEPTFKYFKSHRKSRPKLFNSFKNRAKKAKKVSRKPKVINLAFNPKVDVNYNYVRKKGSKKFSKWNECSKRNIDAVKNWRRDIIINPKLKINFKTLEGARLRMHIRGDGGITKTGYVFYSNTDINLLMGFRGIFFDLIGTCPCGEHESRLCFSKTASRVFIEKLGYLTGFEHKYDWGVDQDILQGNDGIKAAAISAYFDDEGRFHANSLEVVKSRDMGFLRKKILEKVIANPRKYPQFAPKIILDLKEMLESLGIEVSSPFFYRGDLLLTIDNENKVHLMAGWRLRISGEKNIRFFDEKVGFKHKKRDKKIKHYLKNIKVHKAQRNRSWLLALEKCNNLKEEGKVINFPNLLAISERSKTQVRRWIVDLRKRGLLKPKPYNRVRKRNKKGHFITINSKEYKLIKN